MTFSEAELVNKFAKDVKTIANRVVEVEFSWLQINPPQNYRLRIKEEHFLEAQKYVRSKKLINIKFEKFVGLITPILANDAVEISNSVIRATFDELFDQNSNGTLEPEELESLFILLHGLENFNQKLFHENMRQLLGHRANHLAFKDFYEFIKCGYLRELFMS